MKQKSKNKQVIGQARKYDQVSSIEKFLETSNMKYLNKLLQIEGFSSISKLFVYLGLIGFVLFVLSIFISIFWLFSWIYVLILIVLSGFLFSKPNKKFNPTLVIGILAFMIFVPSIYGQGLLSIFTPLDQQSATMDDALEWEDELTEKLHWANTYGGYWEHDLRAKAMMKSDSAEKIAEDIFSKKVDGSVNLDDTEMRKLENYLSYVRSHLNSFKEKSITEWGIDLKGKLLAGKTIDGLREAILDKDLSYEEIRDDWFQSMPDYMDRKLEYLVKLLKERYQEIVVDADGNTHTTGSENADNELGESEFSLVNLGGFRDTLDKLQTNPFSNVMEYTTNFMHLLNWIVFIACICYTGVAVAEGIKLNLGEAVKRAVFVALAVGIMTFIYSMFTSIGMPIIPVWETVGSAWESMMGNFGLAMLDQSGDAVVTVQSVGNGLFSWTPLIFPLVFLGLAIGFRKTDFESMLFAKEILKKDVIEVSESKFSVGVGVLLFFMGIYIIGYFLVTATPDLVINPAVTLSFYIFAVVVLILIGFKFLILNKDQSIQKAVWNTVKYTVFGLMMLFLWFQVMQPVMYSLNFTDTETSLLVLSQNQEIFETDLFKQFFLVAMPETLIFQIFAIGLGNRVKFFLQRTRASRDEIKRKKKQRWDKAIKYRKIGLSQADLKKEEYSTEDIRKILETVLVKRDYDILTVEIEEEKVSKMPVSFFIISTVIGGLIGSFFFSWYHSFRRGYTFVEWWQSPNHGLVYFGAGFLLCFIAFFSFPAAILVHALNNLLAIWVSGG